MFPANYFGPVNAGSGGTVPASSDVRFGVGVGTGTGTLVLPVPAYVHASQSYDAGGTATGLLTLPGGGNVLTTNGPFGVGGNGTTPTYVVVAPANVRSGITFGASLAQSGTMVMPAAQYVLNTVTFDNGTTGTLTLTSGTNVIATASAFGVAGNSVTPGYTTVTPSNVRLGTVYGPSSAPLTGTFAGSGGGTGGASVITITVS